MIEVNKEITINEEEKVATVVSDKQKDVTQVPGYGFRPGFLREVPSVSHSADSVRRSEILADPEDNFTYDFLKFILENNTSK